MDGADRRGSGICCRPSMRRTLPVTQASRRGRALCSGLGSRAAPRSPDTEGFHLAVRGEDRWGGDGECTQGALVEPSGLHARRRRLRGGARQHVAVLLPDCRERRRRLRRPLSVDHAGRGAPGTARRADDRSRLRTRAPSGPSLTSAAGLEARRGDLRRRRLPDPRLLQRDRRLDGALRRDALGGGFAAGLAERFEAIAGRRRLRLPPAFMAITLRGLPGDPARASSAPRSF